MPVKYYMNRAALELGQNHFATKCICVIHSLMITGHLTQEQVEYMAEAVFVKGENDKFAEEEGE